MIPGYIFTLLDKYGNAYMSPRLITKIGGEEAVIEKLRLRGYECIIEKKIIDENEYGSSRHRKSVDAVVVMKGRTDKICK